MVTLAFKHQEQYEHVGPEVTRSQEGKDYKMVKRDYAWLMISRCSKDHIQVKKEIQAKASKSKDRYIKIRKIKNKITRLRAKD
ncbi:hypothetical protein Tco_0291641 [Tanacetum coccineum]